MNHPPLGAADRLVMAGSGGGVIGIDEVGRGSLAGPVSIAAARFTTIPDWPDVQDSKMVVRRKRVELANRLRSKCDAWAVVEVWPELIDRLNILQAVRGAMRTLVEVLARPGDAIVCDAVNPFDHDVRWTVLAPTRADCTYFCVAAASLIAKVCRDETMTDLARTHTSWGWDRNCGYGTSEHRSRLLEKGRSYLHRETFHLRRVIP